MTTIRQFGLIGLIGLAAAHPVGAVKPDPADPFDGDSRMAARRTVRVHDLPMADFLADLNLQTGIRFFAEGAVADDRITVIARERPLGETLRAVADLYRDEWRRSGDSADRGYILAQSPAQTETEDKARLVRIRAAADVILLEVRFFDQYSGMSEEKLFDRSAALNSAIQGVTDPNRKRDLQVETGVVAQLLGRGDWRKLVNKFMRTLSRDALVSILAGNAVNYAYPADSGAKEFTPEVVKELRGGADQFYSPFSRETQFITLRLSSDSRPDPALRWEMTVGRRGDGGARSLSFKSTLPSTSGLFPKDRSESPGPPNWQSDPAFSARASIALPPLRSEKDSPDAVQRRRTLGEALEALDKAQPQDYVADAFYSTRIAGFEQKDAPVAEALNRLCQTTGHRWWKQNGFVMVRSVAFEADRQAEPPANGVARWTQRAQSGSLDLSDYAEMAALPEDKLGTLRMMSIRGDFPDTLQPVSQARELLRVWGALTRAQRRQAEAAGLPYATMTPEQQRLISLAVDEPATKLQPGKLRVEVQQHRIWAIKVAGDRPSVSGLVSREEAVAQFRIGNPSLKDRDVKQVVNVVVSFIFDAPAGVIGRSYIQLPSRWQDSDSP